MKILCLSFCSWRKSSSRVERDYISLSLWPFFHVCLELPPILVAERLRLMMVLASCLKWHALWVLATTMYWFSLLFSSCCCCNSRSLLPFWYLLNNLSYSTFLSLNRSSFFTTNFFSKFSNSIFCLARSYSFMMLIFLSTCCYHFSVSSCSKRSASSFASQASSYIFWADMHYYTRRSLKYSPLWRFRQGGYACSLCRRLLTSLSCTVLNLSTSAWSLF